MKSFCRLISIGLICLQVLGNSYAFSSTLKMNKKVIHVGAKKIQVEFADTSEKRERGLMFRREMAENEGMLFVFEQEEELRF